MKISVDNAAKVAASLLLVLLGACAMLGVYKVESTRKVTPENANYALKPDRALIVFMRPVLRFYFIEAAIYDVTDGSPVFVASLPGRAKLAFYAKPGKRRYMVVGVDNADFMTTNLDPGKVYYTLVSPSPGPRFWFRSFSVTEPFKNNKLDLNTSRFPSWYKKSRWVENLPIASSLVGAYMPSIRETMAEWLPKWQQRSDIAVLNPEDGQTSLYRAAPAN